MTLPPVIEWPASLAHLELSFRPGPGTRVDLRCLETCTASIKLQVPSP